MQLATTCEDPCIVGTAVVNSGSDMGQLAPIAQQVMERTGRVCGEWLVDGGFPAHEQLDAVHEHTRVRAVVGLYVLAHNLLRIARLAPELIGCGAQLRPRWPYRPPEGVHDAQEPWRACLDFCVNGPYFPQEGCYGDQEGDCGRAAEGR